MTIKLDDPAYVRSIPTTMLITFHWKDGRVTEHRCFAYEVNAEGEIKLWGWLLVPPDLAIPMVYEDRGYGLYHRRYLDRVVVDRDG